MRRQLTTSTRAHSRSGSDMRMCVFGGNIPRGHFVDFRNRVGTVAGSVTRSATGDRPTAIEGIQDVSSDLTINIRP